MFHQPASQRVLSSPELLSLIFGFLAHTPGGSEDEEEQQEIARNKLLLDSSSIVKCTCSCTQCTLDDSTSVLTLSLPSPFAIPLVSNAPNDDHLDGECHDQGFQNLPWKGKERMRVGDDEEDEKGPDQAPCHCHLPVHRQLSGLFKPPLFDTRRPLVSDSGLNHPSYNLNNALVCKTWSSVALDVLWRVVDRPERLFALLDGAWGSKLVEPSSYRLRKLRGLCLEERGKGRVPKWWKAGVKAFLELPGDDNDTEAEQGVESAPDPQHPRAKRVRRREFELYSFRATPTPTSWSRFDIYSRRVKHLIYTRPCLSSSALNAIAVTRPRLAVLPKLHSLSWADNPLNHAVVFMHEGIRSLELRISVFGAYKVDGGVSVETVAGMYAEMGLDGYEYSDVPAGEEDMAELFGISKDSSEGEEYNETGKEEGERVLLPNKTLTRTLATQLSEIPRRMPNIQTLCISSFIPSSLYLPALLCTLFRSDSSSSSEYPPLSKLRSITLPRYYTSALLLERLVRLPNLETLEHEWDEGVGWGRPGDVGVGKCVPDGWNTIDMDALQESLNSTGEDSSKGKKRWFSGLFGRVGKENLEKGVGAVNAEDREEQAELEEAAQMLVPVAATSPSSSPVRPSPKSRRSRSSGHQRRSSSHSASAKLRVRSYGIELVEDDDDVDDDGDSPFASPLRRPSSCLRRTSAICDSGSEGVFNKLADLSLTIPICEAKKLLLSFPPPTASTAPRTPFDPSNASASNPPSPLKQPKSIGNNLPPTWPQNLVCLYIESPPGILSSSQEIGDFIRAIALSCYNHHVQGQLAPSRLERLGIVCCADPNSGCEALFGRYAPEGDSGRRRSGDASGRLSLKTIEPLLELIPVVDVEPVGAGEEGEGEGGQHGDSTKPGAQPDQKGKRKAAAVKLEPKFALKSFEISHHLPMDLSQEDVEMIAQRWGGCIEKLTLCCEPMAAFGLSQTPSTNSHRWGTTLTLAALLPFARHCPELRELGLFVDATRGVKGLVGPLFDDEGSTSSSSVPVTSSSPSLSNASPSTQPNLSDTESNPTTIDTYTRSIAQQYLSGPLSNPEIPHTYPVFKSLVRLNMGVSAIEVEIGDLEGAGYDLSLAKRKVQEGRDVGLDVDSENQDDEEEEEQEEGLRGLLVQAARIRLQKQANTEEQAEEEYEDELDFIRKTGVRLGLAEEDDIEFSELRSQAGHSATPGLDYSSTGSLVPVFLAQILPCFPAQSRPYHGSSTTSGRGAAEMGCFTTVIEAGMTWSASAPSFMASSRAVEESWDVGEPYEVEKAKQKERKERERLEQRESEDQQVLEDDQEEEEDVSLEGEGEKQDNNEPGQGPSAEGGEEDYWKYYDGGLDDEDAEPYQLQGPTPKAPPGNQIAHTNLATSPSTIQPGSITIPFLPIPPSFSPPRYYYPPLLNHLVRARVDKWTAMNEQVLPMAVAMREGSWVWGGRVARELAKRRKEVDELSVRVDVVDGLRQMRSKNAKGVGKEQGVGVPDGCIII